MVFLGTRIAAKEAAREENVCGKTHLFFYEPRAGTQAITLLWSCLPAKAQLRAEQTAKGQ